MRYYYDESTLDDALAYAFVHSRLGLKMRTVGSLPAGAQDGKRYLDDESTEKLNGLNREQRYTMKAWRIWPKEEE